MEGELLQSDTRGSYGGDDCWGGREERRRDRDKDGRGRQYREERRSETLIKEEMEGEKVEKMNEREEMQEKERTRIEDTVF